MHNYTQEEIDRAKKRADALNDHGAMLLHLRFGRIYTEASLDEQLEKALAKPEHEIITTRARYYTALVKQYGVPKGARD